MAVAVHTALEADPAVRFETAKAMARALTSVLRSEAEHADAEPLGASVRAARVRLGKDPDESPKTSGPPAPAPAALPATPTPTVEHPPPEAAPLPSAEEISLTELEVSDKLDAPRPRGLWKEKSSSHESPVPLVKKK
jgi:hypothetical protein